MDARPPNAAGYIDAIAEVDRWSPRSILRRMALTGLSARESLAGRLRRDLARPRVQVLILHHVLRDEVAGFRRTLRALSEHFTFIPYGEAVNRTLEGRIDRPYLAVTFDDGYASCTTAATVLEEFGARGCFFVCPFGPTVTTLAEAERFCRERFGFPPSRFMSWDEMGQLVSRGHEVGGHTYSHPPDMSKLSEPELADEIGRCREEIVRRLGAASGEHFAWPIGSFRVFPPAARRLVYASGFRTCTSAVRGCHVAGGPADPAKLCVRRDHLFANWPVAHTLYFMAQNSRRVAPGDGGWPAEYAA